MKNLLLFWKTLMIALFMSINLTAQNYHYEESFMGSTMPANWNLNSTSSNTWTLFNNSQGSYMGLSVDSGGTQMETLTSPSMDLSAVTNDAHVTFEVRLYPSSVFLTYDIADLSIEVSNDNFATYTEIWKDNDATPNEFVLNVYNKTISKSLTSLGYTGAGNSNVKIRFVFSSTSATNNYAYAQVHRLRVSTDCPYTSAKTMDHDGFTWYPIDNFTGTYEIEYGPSGFLPGTGTLVTGLTGTSYTLPNSLCSYEVYIRANCGGTQGQLTWNRFYGYFNYIYTTVTNNSATINWASSAPSIDIEYGPQGYTQGTGTLISGITGSSQIISGLSSCTSYNYYVRTNCGNGNIGTWSNVRSFSTISNNTSPTSLPYTESFNDGLCQIGFNSISGINRSGSGYGNRLMLRGTNAYVGEVESRPFPLVQNTPVTLSFTYQGIYNGDNNWLRVYLKNDTTNEETIVDSRYTTNNNLYTVSTTMIANTTDNYRLVFRTGSVNYSIGYYIDDLSVTNCGIYLDRDYSYTQTDLILTTENSATMNFFKNCDSYDIEYGVQGFAQGTGTLISNITGNSTTINSLNSCTRYSAYVRYHCGSFTSEWLFYNFETKGNSLSQNTPYLEDFNVSSGLLCDIGWKASKGRGFAGPYLYLVSYASTDISNYPPNYFDSRVITKGLNLSAGTEYKISYLYRRGDATPTLNPTMKVTIGTNEDINTHSIIKNYGTNGIPLSGSTFLTEDIYFTPTTSGIHYIGFVVPFTNVFEVIYLDNFSVDLSPIIWTGSPTPSWSNGIGPDASMAAIIDVDYNGPSFEAGNLTVNTGNTLTIVANESVTVNGNVTNNGNIVVESDGNFLQDATSVYSGAGTFTLNRATTGAVDKYTGWSSPVEGQNMFDIYAAGTPQYVLTYNTNTDYYDVQANPATAVTGLGYSVKIPTGATTTSFVGAPNNGEVILTLDNDATDNANGNTYNFIGNPYPSNLSLTDFYNANSTNIGSTFYFWDSGAGNTSATQTGSQTTVTGWAYYNAGSGTWTNATSSTYAPNGTIAKPGQAFVVSATTTGSGSVTIDNSMRTVTNGNFFNKNTSIGEGKYWLRLTTPSNTHNTLAVTYGQGAQNTFDLFDSELNGIGSDAFYSIISPSKLAIQGRASFLNTDIVPLGNKQFQDGVHTISLLNSEGLFANNGQMIILHDKYLGTYTDLQNGAYTFQATDGEQMDRFEVVYQTQGALSTNEMTKENPIDLYRADNDFVVISKGQIESIEIYDASGRLVKSLEPNVKKVSLGITERGVYVVKIISGKNKLVKKIVK